MVFFIRKTINGGCNNRAYGNVSFIMDFLISATIMSKGPWVLIQIEVIK